MRSSALENMRGMPMPPELNLQEDKPPGNSGGTSPSDAYEVS